MALEAYIEETMNCETATSLKIAIRLRRIPTGRIYGFALIAFLCLLLNTLTGAGEKQARTTDSLETYSKLFEKAPAELVNIYLWKYDLATFMDRLSESTASLIVVSAGDSACVEECRKRHIHKVLNRNLAEEMERKIKVSHSLKYSRDGDTLLAECMIEYNGPPEQLTNLGNLTELSHSNNKNFGILNFNFVDLQKICELENLVRVYEDFALESPGSDLNQTRGLKTD